MEATTETLATVQADADHTARHWAARCALANVPAEDLTAWTRHAETAGPDDPTTLAVVPAGTGFVVMFADELDGHPVVATAVAPAGSTPTTFGVDADDRSSGVSVAEVAAELNEIWAREQQVAAAKAQLTEMDAQYADVEL